MEVIAVMSIRTDVINREFLEVYLILESEACQGLQPSWKRIDLETGWISSIPALRQIMEVMQSDTWWWPEALRGQRESSVKR